MLSWCGYGDDSITSISLRNIRGGPMRSFYEARIEFTSHRLYCRHCKARTLLESISRRALEAGRRYQVTGEAEGLSRFGEWETPKKHTSIELRDETLEKVNESELLNEVANLIDEKNYPESDKLKIQSGTMEFFRQYSKLSILLSNGSKVYFMPDIREIERSGALKAWATYCVHQVTNKKNENQRSFNVAKLENIKLISDIIKKERVYYSTRKNDFNDAIVFVGKNNQGEQIKVITHLDDYQNLQTNLVEVTYKIDKSKNPPLKPLTGAVETVVKKITKRQATLRQPTILYHKIR